MTLLALPMLLKALPVSIMVLLLLVPRFARLNCVQQQADGSTVIGKQSLPASAWFESRVRDHNLSSKLKVFTDKANRRANSADACMLVSVHPGLECNGHLTQWSREEDYLWQYFSRAPDCFSLRCAGICVFEKPLLVTCPERLSRPTWGPGEIHIQDMLQAAGKSLSQVAACCRVSEEELGNFTKVPFCMQMHGVFTSLMERQAWSTVMFRVAWLPSSRSMQGVDAHQCFFRAVGMPCSCIVKGLAQALFQRRCYKGGSQSSCAGMRAQLLSSCRICNAGLP